MSLTKRGGVLAGAAALTLTGASFADTTTGANSEDLKAQLQEALQRIEQLETANSDHWLTEQRADEIRGLVHDVLADADTRASLLQSGMTAGYDKGFVINSSDGNFKLKINGQLQFRWVYNSHDGNIASPEGLGTTQQASFIASDLGTTNAGVLAAIATAKDLTGSALDSYNDQIGQATVKGRIDRFINQQISGMSASQKQDYVDALAVAGIDDFSDYAAAVRSAWRDAVVAARPANRSDDDRWGFETRRTKLIFSGHVVDPSWQYKVQGNFDRSGGDFHLEDAIITKAFDNGWNLRIGQFKAPFMREELVSSKYQLAAERSLLNEYYTTDRSQGIQLDTQGDQFSFAVMYNDGSRAANVAALTYDTEFSITSRIEWLAAGNWGQFKDFTSWQDDEYGALLGVALHYQKTEYGDGDGLVTPVNMEADDFRLTVDASVEGGGWNLYGAFVYRNLDVQRGDEYDQYGFLVQGGFFFTPEWEGFIRYEWSDFDIPDVHVAGVSVYEFEDLSVLTLGLNRYYAGHQLKATFDFGYAFDRVEYFAADSGGGYRSDSGGDDGQFVARAQFQLLF